LYRREEGSASSQTSLNSLILSVEHFNRRWDQGRTDAVLMFMDHSFEMLLKAGILHRGGHIREPGQKNTIGFDHCVRRALSDGKVKFLTDEQALTLQAINGLRDAAQHHLVDISEGISTSRLNRASPCIATYRGPSLTKSSEI
jgi:hypothetical protein